MVCAQHAYGLAQLGRVPILLYGIWVREALKRYFVVETKQERIVCTTGAAAIDIFMVRVRMYFMYNVLIILVSCCDSNILIFTQKISVPVSTHEYYVGGTVCGSWY